ncbi:MAG: HK97 family phage prohead protease [Candidatus Gastranaerophilales bacterium]|nr:HK97 family phage prohead protease [Candidatus Gastranaerophilales bacterium]
MTRTIEIRETNFSQDEEQKKILEGYAVVFDCPTVLFEADGIEYKEIIAKEAFNNADLKDVCLKYNHGDSMGILARTRNDSLQIIVDDYGLKFRAKLLDTPSANEVYTNVKNNLLDKCSFAFRCEEDSYNQETHTRTILKIKRVYDLSVVDIPAYDETNVEARSYFDGIAKQQNVMERTKRLKRLICRTYL